MNIDYSDWTKLPAPFEQNYKNIKNILKLDKYLLSKSKHKRLKSNCTDNAWVPQCMCACPDDHLKNAYEHFRYKSSLIWIEYTSFNVQERLFHVKFESVPLKFHTKCLSHTSKDMIFIKHRISKSSLTNELLCTFETPLQSDNGHTNQQLNYTSITEQNTFKLVINKWKCGL